MKASNTVKKNIWFNTLFAVAKYFILKSVVLNRVCGSVLSTCMLGKSGDWYHRTFHVLFLNPSSILIADVKRLVLR